MSRVMLWERKETELMRTWMLFNRNQQTILQTEEQEHSLLSWFVRRHRVD